MKGRIEGTDRVCERLALRIAIVPRVEHETRLDKARNLRTTE